MIVPFFRHWYVPPLAVTEKEADCPTVRVRLAGCEEIWGAHTESEPFPVAKSWVEVAPFRVKAVLPPGVVPVVVLSVMVAVFVLSGELKCTVEGENDAVTP